MSRRFVVISGLPGSGETTLALQLAPPLGLPVLAKDSILEELFDVKGVGDAMWRRRLAGKATRSSKSAQEFPRERFSFFSGIASAWTRIWELQPSGLRGFRGDWSTCIAFARFKSPPNAFCSANGTPDTWTAFAHVKRR